MASRNHTLWLDDQTWESWQKLASELGLSVTKTLVRAVAYMDGMNRVGPDVNGFVKIKIGEPWSENDGRPMSHNRFREFLHRAGEKAE